MLGTVCQGRGLKKRYINYQDHNLMEETNIEINICKAIC